MSSWLRWLVVAMGVLGVAVSADAQWLTQTQTPAPAPAKPEDKPADKPEEKPKTLWEEITLFAYIENSYVCGRPTWSRLLSTRTPSPWRWTTCSSEDVM
jgi:hypothetical protein